ncbi:MAG: hypothetical protein B7Y39_01940 [Bdellovibrio sp. 28-41-41]|nr:MAG: hypothetical protein B7Y39_01940 [Bdellovibrio sp. 28-41-41]
MVVSKRLSIIIGILFLLTAGGGLSMKQLNTNRTLRVAFPEQRKSLSYEPTDIRLGYEYIFLENVFSPLVEIDAKGSIQPGVAEKADWINDELRLKIRDNLKTASGVLITAQDVVFSLKRLLVLSGNTHGNFKDLICPGHILKTVEDECPGIKSEGNYVYLNAKERKPFLLPMLAAIDFAIIPRTSCDPQTLAIINLKETSGPYFVSDDDGNGNIELKLNPNHYHAASDIADIIKLVGMNPKVQGDSLKALVENRVDLLTTIDTVKADELIKFVKHDSDFSIHTTMKIRTMALVFTDRGEREFSAAERRYIGERVKAAFFKIYHDSSGFEKREEFFPSLGEGGLTNDQQSKLAKIRSNGEVEPKKSVRIGLMKRGSFDAWSKPIKEELPLADCYHESGPPDLKKDLKPEDMPHAFVVSTDTAYKEDIGLISFSLNAGFLGVKKPEREKWLANYMATNDKDIRVQKLKALHFEALAAPIIVPFMATPYAAVVRKPWRMELSELYANNPLWLIKIN